MRQVLCKVFIVCFVRVGSLRVSFCRVSEIATLSLCLRNTLNRVEISFIFAFNKASSSVVFYLCLAVGLLFACWILRSACSCLFLSGNICLLCCGCLVFWRLWQRVQKKENIWTYHFCRYPVLWVEIPDIGQLVLPCSPWEGDTLVSLQIWLVHIEINFNQTICKNTAYQWVR